MSHHGLALASQDRALGNGSFKGSLVLSYGGWAVILIFRSPHSVHRSMVLYLTQMSRNTWGEYLKYELVIKSK